MADGEVNIGMDDLNKEEKRVEGEKDTGETSFTDGDQRKRLDDLTGRPTLGSDDMTRVTSDESVPNAGRDSGAMKRAIIEDKKKIFKEEKDLGFTVNVGDGKAFRELLEQTEFTLGKGDKPVKATFRGKVVMVRKTGGGIRRSESQTKDRYVEDFDKLIKEAKAEHSKTLVGAIEKSNNGSTTSLEAVSDISSQIISESESVLEEKEEDLLKQARELLTEKEVREFMGMLKPQGTSVDKIRFLEIEVDYYKEQAASEEDPRKRQLYEKISEVAEMKADTIRIRIGDAPEHIDVLSILGDKVENNDLNRLEKFKKWAKENMVGLSAIAITIAGIVTTIVVAARRTVSGGS